MGRKKKRQSQKAPQRRSAGKTASAPRAAVRAALQQGMSLFQSGRLPEIVAKLSSDDFAQLGLEYINKLKELCDSTEHVTDKMPHNFRHVGMIRLLLPHAKVIHCRRDPVDNCLSIFKHDFKGLHKYSNDQTELGGYYRLYQDLMEHWSRVCRDLCWIFSMRSWLPTRRV